jgi:hypothetical protein
MVIVFKFHFLVTMLSELSVESCETIKSLSLNWLMSTISSFLHVSLGENEDKIMSCFALFLSNLNSLYLDGKIADQLAKGSRMGLSKAMTERVKSKLIVKSKQSVHYLPLPMLTTLTFNEPEEEAGYVRLRLTQAFDLIQKNKILEASKLQEEIRKLAKSRSDYNHVEQPEFENALYRLEAEIKIHKVYQNGCQSLNELKMLSEHLKKNEQQLGNRSWAMLLALFIQSNSEEMKDYLLQLAQNQQGKRIQMFIIRSPH